MIYFSLIFLGITLGIWIALAAIGKFLEITLGEKIFK
jgi:hypothetical protein